LATPRRSHLRAGKVFSAAAHLFESLGEKVERKPDSVTGLSLWDRVEDQKK
jgi:hypothetical protein